jgi:hypothetical protein
MSSDLSKAPLILTQIAQRLHEIFDGKIDLSGMSGGTAEKEQAFLTRAFMALYFIDQAGLSPSEACDCICDGGGDDGIDALYVDKKNSRIYFGQSKWKANMQKGVELKEFTRFRDGIKDVMKLRWTDDNKDLHRFRKDIEEQLSSIDTEVVAIFAHTSENRIAENIYSKIDAFLSEENKYNEFLSFKEFRVNQAAKVARSYTRPENINFNVMLGNWGQISNPYKAVYGSVAAVDVVDWFEKSGNKLFAENLRYGIEKSDVNDGIIATAQTDPANFWYYNNGITAICDAVNKLAIGGPDTASGVFEVQKISVINGAQTISSLSKAAKSGADLSRARIHIRIISLVDTPDDFSSVVTSANNTQNNLNLVDFVASDPNQDRIRREAAQLKLQYTFRRGEKEPERGQGFNIRAATIAAACASGDLRLAVSAKRYISGLWENPKKEPYTRLFSGSTTAAYLWRIVQIMNTVDDCLSDAAADLVGREKLTAIHGNRFILFSVFEAIGSARVKSEEPIEPVLTLAKELTSALLPKVQIEITRLFPEAYPGNIFKNRDRQVELLEAMASQ